MEHERDIVPELGEVRVCVDNKTIPIQQQTPHMQESLQNKTVTKAEVFDAGRKS